MDAIARAVEGRKRGINIEPYKITAELNLEKIIAELREVAQAFYECADDLERIEKKYADPQESEDKE